MFQIVFGEVNRFGRHSFLTFYGLIHIEKGAFLINFIFSDFLQLNLMVHMGELVIQEVHWLKWDLVGISFQNIHHFVRCVSDLVHPWPVLVLCQFEVPMMSRVFSEGYGLECEGSFYQHRRGRFLIFFDVEWFFIDFKIQKAWLLELSSGSLAILIFQDQCSK